MKKSNVVKVGIVGAALWIPSHLTLYAAISGNSSDDYSSILLLTTVAVLVGILIFSALYLYSKTKQISEVMKRRIGTNDGRFSKYIETFDSKQIDQYFKFKSKEGIKGGQGNLLTTLLLTTAMCLSANTASSQSSRSTGSLLTEGGILITLVLILVPIAAGIILMIVKIRQVLKVYQNKENQEEGERLAEYLKEIDGKELENALLKRKHALDYGLNHNELTGHLAAEDDKGLLLDVSNSAILPVVSAKKRATKRPAIDPELSRLILWFLGSATFWLLFGTTVGEYLGIKFVAPDVDQVSWLSFGRLRPVHTNAVFWGWASMAMLGLGYYVVPRVSNIPLVSIKLGWWTLYLINASVILGSVFLMAGINNGGGEYREYIWPIQLLFGIGLLLTLINFLRTIARRTTHEIYISNWYIVASVMFALVISIVAYIPTWQNGLGETIVQGYYMHQGVGMWFMLFTLGIVYYFLPQQLNKPIYSYSLGILAFWAQILFYTVIGTHHFVFSSIPWSLQTIAIVGSVGMVIPVAAGTANFLLTFNGAWYKLPSSYTLPFFLVGVIFYFTGSLQGTAEAFRSTNLIWHFTDFTVAHSHLTMYGIICFFLWAGIYALVPRLSGKEAPQITVGAHFWLALIGLLFYTIPLMYGSTLKGLMWIDGKPFIDSVVLMAPYWLWRAIGGSLMWLSHIFFAYNIYKMLTGSPPVDVREAAIAKLNQSYATTEPEL
ncbi:cbb3-type cytochrome c oxidase subunit I [Paradesertivirga mongoliensis]|uniref:Cbb3-type cytochrome c oxidase subunit I n=1 Tax=Paradesertivirga mongoliensis TaxID=2100740 RepID=A0ABW4ZQ86_9SPHI|nr:cbb3-type cytochrome c oxidase subunit I [Pedobacter mongoliensis]